MTDYISREAVLIALNKVDCSDGVGLSAIACGVVEEVEETVKRIPAADVRPAV